MKVVAAVVAALFLAAFIYAASRSGPGPDTSDVTNPTAPAGGGDPSRLAIAQRMAALEAQVKRGNASAEARAAAAAGAREAPVRVQAVGSRVTTPEGAFPSGAPFRPGAVSHLAHGSRSIWAEDLPSEASGPRGVMSTLQTGGSRTGSGRGMLLRDDKGAMRSDLFDRSPDHLDKGDIDIENDAFPAKEHGAPANSHEAIMQQFTFKNLRHAHDLNAPQTYLAPSLDRGAGWKKLGMRTFPGQWEDATAKLREEIERSGNVEAYIDGLAGPVSEQYLDFLYSIAEESGVHAPHNGASVGMGGKAAGRLYSRRHNPDGSVKKPVRKDHSGHLAALNAINQSIPTTDAAAAAQVMRQIARARMEANSRRLDIPMMRSDQLQAVADWLHSGAVGADSPVKRAAHELSEIAGAPLPPARVSTPVRSK